MELVQFLILYIKIKLTINDLAAFGNCKIAFKTLTNLTPPVNGQLRPDFEATQMPIALLLEGGYYAIPRKYRTSDDQLRYEFWVFQANAGTAVIEPVTSGTNMGAGLLIYLEVI